MNDINCRFMSRILSSTMRKYVWSISQVHSISYQIKSCFQINLRIILLHDHLVFDHSAPANPAYHQRYAQDEQRCQCNHGRDQQLSHNRQAHAWFE